MNLLKNYKYVDFVKVCKLCMKVEHKIRQMSLVTVLTQSFTLSSVIAFLTFKISKTMTGKSCICCQIYSPLCERGELGIFFITNLLFSMKCDRLYHPAESIYFAGPYNLIKAQKLPYNFWSICVNYLWSHELSS